MKRKGQGGDTGSLDHLMMTSTLRKAGSEEKTSEST